MTIADPDRAARRPWMAIGCTCSRRAATSRAIKTDGTAVWQRNILKEFGGRQLQWLISESPLVDGAHLIVQPGRSGRRDGEARQDDGQDGVAGEAI